MTEVTVRVELPLTVQEALKVLYSYADGNRELMDKVAGAYACGRGCSPYRFEVGSPHYGEQEKALFAGTKERENIDKRKLAGVTAGTKWAAETIRPGEEYQAPEGAFRMQLESRLVTEALVTRELLDQLSEDTIDRLYIELKGPEFDNGTTGRRREWLLELQR